MSGINNAENQIENALPNKIVQLQRDFNDFRTTPQSIGNGSINYATFSATTAGPFTIPAGLTANVGVLFMNHLLPFTYDGLDAINKTTLMDVLYDIAVDVNDSDHYYPQGSALTSNQRKVDTNQRYVMSLSGLSDTNGERYVNIKVENKDASTHDYWVIITALIPRPALKPL